jgi:hypothetical protein
MKKQGVFRKKPADGLIEITSLDDIPEFSNEEEADQWWSTHSLSAELWRQARPLAAELGLPSQPAGDSRVRT